MLEGVRWCSVALGRRSGRSCWPLCSSVLGGTWGPGRAAGAAAAAGGAGGRPRGGVGGRTTSAELFPSPLSNWKIFSLTAAPPQKAQWILFGLARQM